MVIPQAWSAASLCLCLLADSPLSRLEPVARARLLGGIILLAIGGVALIVLCWLAMRVGRRTLRREDAILRKLDHHHAATDDWAGKPLAGRDRVESDDNLG